MRKTSDFFKYIVYGLVDPNTNELRYIGKSTSGLDRAREHAKPSNLKLDGNTKKANWIRKLKSNNQTYKIILLYYLGISTKSKEEINHILYEKEQQLINVFKYFDFDLTNAQDGGPGSTGRPTSDNTRIKMSVSAKKRLLPQALINNQKPKFQDPPGKRICSKCLEAKNLNDFYSPKKNRICKICRPIFYPRNRSIPGARQAFNDKRKTKIIAIDLYGKEINYLGMNHAARTIGGKCSKTGIRFAIQKKTLYYGYYWKKP